MSISRDSRTSKSIYNSSVALLIYFINLILGFISRSIFIKYLGAEVLGLNTTATSILQFLNLAELGIGSAIACLLYKPLFDDNRVLIKEIIALQGWLYRKIACLIIGISIVIMCFFPIIFKKIEIPLWYAYASFSVLLFSSLLSYFVNYKQIILSANQQEYKINFSYKAVISFKVLVQIIAVSNLSNGYVWWLILEVIFAIVASLTLNRQINKTFPYLKERIDNPKSLRTKYPEVIVKIKQLFFHKIGSFVLSQSSPLIIYAYASLTVVTIYGNYMLIVVGLGMLLTAIFNGLGASVGNLVAQGDINQITRVFRELFTSRFLLITTCCYVVYYVATPFVDLWVGQQFELESLSVFLIVIIFYLTNERVTIHSFLNAYGLFSDIWAPIVEAIINICLSSLLGAVYGLNGVLVGVAISLFIIPMCWKPYYLFKQGFKKPIILYIVLYAKHISLFAMVCWFCTYVIDVPNIITVTNYFNLIWSAILMAVLFGVTLFILLYVSEAGMQLFAKRIVLLISKHIS